MTPVDAIMAVIFIVLVAISAWIAWTRSGTKYKELLDRALEKEK